MHVARCLSRCTAGLYNTRPSARVLGTVDVPTESCRVLSAVFAAVRHDSPANVWLLQQSSRTPPPAYTESPASNEVITGADNAAQQCVVRGEPVLPTAVPLQDIESASKTGGSSNAGGSAGGSGNEHGIAVGPPELEAGRAVGIPMAQAVGSGSAAASMSEFGGELGGRFPPQGMDDLPMPEVRRGLMLSYRFA